MKRLLPVIIFFLVASLISAQKWSDQDARLTKGELLQLVFGMESEGTSKASFNSWNLISFYPGPTTEKAVLVIIQTYNMKGWAIASADTRREIRLVAGSLVNRFVAKCTLPIIKKRWEPADPRTQIVIKHVREDDIQEILAVTVNGETSFDADAVQAAEAQVTAAGGVWRF